MMERGWATHTLLATRLEPRYDSLHQLPPQHHANAVLSTVPTPCYSGSSPISIRKDNKTLLARRRIGPRTGDLRYQTENEFRKEIQRGADNEVNNKILNTWILGSKHCLNNTRGTTETQATELDWGSDSNFSTFQSHRLASGKETVELNQNLQMRFFDYLEPRKLVRSTQSGNRRTEPEELAQPRQIGQCNGADTSPRRRLTVKRQNGSAETRGKDESNSDINNFKRTKHGNRMQSSTSRLGLCRRKYAVSGGPRGTLSDAQKRENHIRSEQKRRDLLKTGFHDIIELVPGFEGKGLTRSTVLFMAAEWLEKLVQGNQTLEAQLRSISH